MREAVHHCQEANTLHPACLQEEDPELTLTPTIHGSTFELHESSPIELGVCEGYDTVEAVSED